MMRTSSSAFVAAIAAQRRFRTAENGYRKALRLLDGVVDERHPTRVACARATPTCSASSDATARQPNSHQELNVGAAMSLTFFRPCATSQKRYRYPTRPFEVGIQLCLRDDEAPGCSRRASRF